MEEEEKAKGNSFFSSTRGRRRVRDGGAVEEEQERLSTRRECGQVSVDIEATCIDGAGPNRYWGRIQDDERSVTRLASSGRFVQGPGRQPKPSGPPGRGQGGGATTKSPWPCASPTKLSYWTTGTTGEHGSWMLGGVGAGAGAGTSCWVAGCGDRGGGYESRGWMMMMMMRRRMLAPSPSRSLSPSSLLYSATLPLSYSLSSPSLLHSIPTLPLPAPISPSFRLLVAPANQAAPLLPLRSTARAAAGNGRCRSHPGCSPRTLGGPGAKGV
jgi:hypothetical protein